MVWRRRLDSFANVRQIPGINGVIGTLLNKLPGDIWEIAEIEELNNQSKKKN